MFYILERSDSQDRWRRCWRNARTIPLAASRSSQTLRSYPGNIGEQFIKMADIPIHWLGQLRRTLVAFGRFRDEVGLHRSTSAYVGLARDRPGCGRSWPTTIQMCRPIGGNQTTHSHVGALARGGDNDREFRHRLRRLILVHGLRNV